MIASLRIWWSDHSASERGLMAVLGLAILIIFLWLGIWRPVTDGLEASETRLGAALDRYGSVRAKVEALKRLPARPLRATLPVEQVVTQTATEAGFILDRVGAQGPGRMAVSIGSARTSALLSWISRLEEAGVGVRSINIVPGQAPGTVAVQAVFQDGSQL